MSRVALLVVTATLLGCSAKAIVIGENPEEGGAPGTGSTPVDDSVTGTTTGGEDPVVLRSMTIEVERAALYVVEPPGPIADLVVFSNDAHGNLLSSTKSNELGIATLDVTDGGFVSVAVPYASTGYDWASHRIESVRVLEGIESLRIPIEAFAWPELAPGTMTLEVSFPEVAGADQYEVTASCLAGYVSVDAPATAVTIDEYHACKDAESFWVMVTSSVGSGVDGSLDAYRMGWQSGLVFEPGTTATIAIDEMVENETATVEVKSVADTDRVRFAASRISDEGFALSQFPASEDHIVDGEVVGMLFAPSVEGMRVQASGRIEPTDCVWVSWSKVSDDLESSSIDPFRLAKEQPAAAGHWKLGPGDLGDAVRLERSWSWADFSFRWNVYEPPASEGQSPPIFDLPDEVEENFDTLYDVTEDPVPFAIDVREAEDFTTFFRLYRSATPHESEERQEDFCFPDGI
ncbi:MAG: hypothetical protein HOW73_03020 [Polyangiaceae bacterium]|nr:hypothetical protein [Polyangiaceae bacterium]